MIGYLTPWARCYDCGKVVKLNKPLFGALHLCLTRCERRGYHSKLLFHERVGAFWKRRTRYRCMDCYSSVPGPCACGEPKAAKHS